MSDSNSPAINISPLTSKTATSSPERDVQYYDPVQEDISNSLNKELTDQRVSLSTLSRVATADIEKLPSVFKSHFQELICIITLTFAPACVSMSMGAYTIAISDTIKDLNVKGSSSTWLIGSISLANGATLILMGSLADAIGRRNCIVVGYSAYAVFSLIGGFMHSLVSLCILRALAGVLISLALTSSFGLVGATYVEGSRRKNKFNAIISAGNPLGGAVGNFCGAICVQFVGSWRDCQYFFAILYALLSVIAWYSVPKDKKINWSELKQILLTLDYVGAFLSLAGFTLVCFSLTQVDVTEERWKTPYIIALLVVGCLLFICLLLWEAYVPLKRPLIPMKIWLNKNFTICAIIMFFDWVAFTGIFAYYSVLYFEQILGNSAILTAAKMVPMFVVGTLTNIVAALVLHRISGKIIMMIGCTGFLACMIIWATLDINRNYFLGVFWCAITSVIGADSVWNVASLVSYSSVSKELQSSASGLLNMLIMLAGVIGLAISSTIVSSTDYDYGTDKQYDDLNKLFKAYRTTFYFGIGCTAISLIACLFLDVGKFKREERKVDEES